MYHRFRWTSSSRRRNGISQEYEPIQPYFLLAMIRAAGCRTFVDVGANIGAYSILMSQANLRIEAFEANPDAAAEMRANLALNGLAGTVHQIAISNRVGKLSFGSVSRLAGNSAVVDTARGQNFRSVHEVPCTTLDAVIPDLPAPVAIKIDVEGHEREVLAGAGALLAQPSILQVESFESPIEIEGHHRVASIGPDHYYTNLPGLEARSLFERAAALLIEANHENKRAELHLGDFGVSVRGKSYEFVKRLALRLVGKHL